MPVEVVRLLSTLSPKNFPLPKQPIQSHKPAVHTIPQKRETEM